MTTYKASDNIKNIIKELPIVGCNINNLESDFNKDHIFEEPNDILFLYYVMGVMNALNPNSVFNKNYVNKGTIQFPKTDSV
jgi:hypothetical protein